MFLHECFGLEKCLDTGVEWCSFVFSTLLKMYIHPLSKGSFGLSYILEATFRTVNDVDQITEFTSNFTSWWEILAVGLLLSAESSDTVQLLNFRTVGAFTWSYTYWYLAPRSQRFLYEGVSDFGRCEFVPEVWESSEAHDWFFREDLV